MLIALKFHEGVNGFSVLIPVKPEIYSLEKKIGFSPSKYNLLHNLLHDINSNQTRKIQLTSFAQVNVKIIIIVT